MTDTAVRSWTVRIPQPAPWLTANIDRNKYGRAALVRAWRRATVDACAGMDLPHRISPVTIHAVICHMRARPPVNDRLNLAPTIKAVVDALTPARVIHYVNGKVAHVHGYGLLPDDSDRHVLDTSWLLLHATWDGIELTISASTEAVEQQPLFDIPATRRSPSGRQHLRQVR